MAQSLSSTHAAELQITAHPKTLHAHLNILHLMDDASHKQAASFIEHLLDTLTFEGLSCQTSNAVSKLHNLWTTSSLEDCEGEMGLDLERMVDRLLASDEEDEEMFLSSSLERMVDDLLLSDEEDEDRVVYNVPNWEEEG